MRILFNMAHPGQIHLFKNAIWALEKRGHDCKITTVDKDVSLNLLGAYGFEYDVVGSAKPSLFSKATELLKIEYNLYRIARSFKPDILVGGVGNAYVAHVGKIIRKPSIVFDDTEHAKIEHILTDPFASVICTPSCYKADLGKKQIRYDGYHELAYLHPDYFTPNPEVLSELGLNEDDTFIILRFVKWDADHDIGQYGIQNKIEFVNELEKHGRVLITSEGEMDYSLKKYRIKVSPEKLHDLLYYASLYVGEGGTTAVESAILGTPSIYVSSLVGTMGNFTELEEKYGLLFNYKDSDKALNKAVELIHDPSTKEEWNKRREQLLRDKIDVTAFMVRYIENFNNLTSKPLSA
ncbi:DUF354 domain-containing protein [Methanococcoides alaskense]|nr:DUF354 domain-containing protein [Methanococcoides alaskense]MDA0524654.1 DUF354 domain-containing protein [Methanococcoides alaskense]